MSVTPALYQVDTPPDKTRHGPSPGCQLCHFLSASIPFSASDGEKVAEGRMRCLRESGERACGVGREGLPLGLPPGLHHAGSAIEARQTEAMSDNLSEMRGSI